MLIDFKKLHQTHLMLHNIESNYDDYYIDIPYPEYNFGDWLMDWDFSLNYKNNNITLYKTIYIDSNYDHPIEFTIPIHIIGTDLVHLKKWYSEEIEKIQKAELEDKKRRIRELEFNIERDKKILETLKNEPHAK